QAESRQLISEYCIDDGYKYLLKSINSVIHEYYDLHGKVSLSTDLAMLYAKRQYHQETIETLNKAVELAQNSYPIRLFCAFMESAKSYSIINEHVLADKAISNAREALPKISKGLFSLYPEYLISIARICCEKNENNRAILLLDKAYELSAEGLLFPLDNRLLVELAEAYSDIGLLKKAEDAANKIIPVYKTYNIYGSYVYCSDIDRVGATAYVAGRYAEMGSTKRAYELLNEINQQTKTKSKEIITAYAKLKEWEKAMSLTAAEEESEFFLINCPYLVITKHAVSAGRGDVAADALNKMARAVENNNDSLYWRIPESIIETADEVLLLGDDDNAIKYLKYAVEKSQALLEDGGSMFYPTDLAKAGAVWLKMGNISEGVGLLHEALEHIITQNDDFLKGSSLINIAEIFFNSNIAIKEKEKELLRRIVDSCEGENYDI
ncbi:MAG: hypothetical protein AABY79_10840, partial [Nitrospirota bacterium]